MKRKPYVTMNDTEALRYAVHPFIVTRKADEIGNREIAAHLNDREAALQCASEQPDGRVWRKTNIGYAAVRPPTGRAG